MPCFLILLLFFRCRCLSSSGIFRQSFSAYLVVCFYSMFSLVMFSVFFGSVYLFSVLSCLFSAFVLRLSWLLLTPFQSFSSSSPLLWTVLVVPVLSLLLSGLICLSSSSGFFWLFGYWFLFPWLLLLCRLCVVALPLLVLCGRCIL